MKTFRTYSLNCSGLLLKSSTPSTHGEQSCFGWQIPTSLHSCGVPLAAPNPEPPWIPLSFAPLVTVLTLTYPSHTTRSMH